MRRKRLISRVLAAIKDLLQKFIPFFALSSIRYENLNKILIKLGEKAGMTNDCYISQMPHKKIA